MLTSLNRLRWQRRGSQDSLAQPLLGGAAARSDGARSEGPRSDDAALPAAPPEQLSPLMVLAYSNVGVLLGVLLVPAGLLWPSLLALVYLLVVLRRAWVWAQAGTGHASRRSVALLQVSLTQAGTAPSTAACSTAYPSSGLPKGASCFPNQTYMLTRTLGNCKLLCG